jgi:site-specific DNA-methyltransferase (adenine-specific)
VEQAGFEIRDQIMWIYSSGFPKSQDVGKSIDKKAGIKHDYVDYHNEQDDTRNVSNNANAKNRHCKKCNKQLGTSNLQCSESPCPIKNPPIQSEWAGWGTALKPAHEPIVLARKPTKLTYAQNVQQWGTGALNIDAARIPTDEVMLPTAPRTSSFHNNTGVGNNTISGGDGSPDWIPNEQGRFPSNVLGDIPLYQKYFYCPKVSRRERHTGFDETPYNGNNKPGGMYGPNQSITRNNVPNVSNNHPTVKPVALMEYLIKLITPPGGTVLDPFNGSGSTGMAAVALGCEYIGIELDPNYVKIAETRISAWQTRDQADNTFDQLFEEKDIGA